MILYTMNVVEGHPFREHSSKMKFLKLGDEYLVYNEFGKMIYKYNREFNLYEFINMYEFFIEENDNYEFISSNEFLMHTTPTDLPTPYKFKDKFYIQSSTGELARLDNGLWVVDNDISLDLCNAEKCQFDEVISYGDEVLEDTINKMRESGELPKNKV